MKKIFVLAMLVASINAFGQNSEALNDAYILSFSPGSTTLEKSYSTNSIVINNLINKVLRNSSAIKCGEKTIEITGYISSEISNNYKAINSVSIQASVVRALIKTKTGFDNTCFKFEIDNSQNLNNVIEISIKNQSESVITNSDIFYTLTPSTSGINAAIAKYKPIPYKSNSAALKAKIAEQQKQREEEQEKLELQKAAEAKQKAEAEKIAENQRRAEQEILDEKNRVAEAFKAEEKIKEEESVKKEVTLNSEIALKHDRKEISIKSKKTGFVLHPYFAIKTNAVSWAGFNPSLEEDRGEYIPNMEFEIYFANRYSLALDGIYAPVNRGSNVGKSEWWNINGIACEPRFWFNNSGKNKGAFKGFYAGIFGITGEFDVKRESIGTLGYTGEYYGSGISLGFVQPLLGGLSLEIGARGGYRIADWDSYEVRNGGYYYQESGSEKGFKLQGIRLNIMYRFGKRMKIFAK